MEWNNKLPTGPGRYLYRKSYWKNDDSFITTIVERGGNLVVIDEEFGDWPLAILDCPHNDALFYGPIEEDE